MKHGVVPLPLVWDQSHTSTTFIPLSVCLSPLILPIYLLTLILPGFLLLEEISFGVDDGVEHAEGLLRADGHAAVAAAVQILLGVVLKSKYSAYRIL